MIAGRREVEIPGFVRIKPGAMDRIGLYLGRAEFKRVVILHSQGLPDSILDQASNSIQSESIEATHVIAIDDTSLEQAEHLSTQLPKETDCILGIGGGKALDVAKLVASRCDTKMFTLPTSLSNDGFASPQSSLTIEGRRKSVPANMPTGVVVDTQICLDAPKILWLSGVGDLVAKITAVRDWKLAFHHDRTPVDDFAALLSDASVFQFMGRPERDLEGIRLLATALMLNGVSMAISGNSRPASGSEHLVSHALDSISSRPRLHGLQVGVATYAISQLHRTETERIRHLFETTGFWQAIYDDPFCKSEWSEAIALAPSLKANFHTILSTQENREALLGILSSDDTLRRCFVD